MKSTIKEEPNELPKVGGFWKLVDSDEIFIRINDFEGKRALALSDEEANGVFFDVSLRNGAVYYMPRSSKIRLIKSEVEKLIQIF